MRILVDENIPQGPEVFSAYGTVNTFHGRKLAAADVKDADALLVRSITRVNAGLLDGSRVRFVGTATIGVDHIDQDYLRARGIGFSAAPGCNARSVAEYFVAALLHLHVKHGLEVDGKTLGIVGYGNVGRAVAAIAPALGLKVIVSDPPLVDAGEPGTFVSLLEIAERADIVTMHTPLTKTGAHPTFRMANAAFYAAIEKSARPIVLMNMGRGEAMDEPALLAALEAGRVSRLVLDVFPGEPNVNPELARRADLISPHIAGYSIQGKLNGTGQILAAFCRHFGLEKTAAVKFPVPEDHVIRMDGTPARTIEAELNDCVRRSYAIDRDDSALRAFLGDPEFPKHFDALRKNYPVRHEFAGFRITGLSPGKKILAEKLTGLGFSVE
jgi:erythronate-4-phosphate dehydrogenase